MSSLTILLSLLLTACALKTAPTAQAPKPPPDPRGHCTADELVLFSCPLQNGETASLCASSDLGQGPGLGTVQFRMGAQGSPSVAYPHLPKSPEFFRYTHETYARSYGDTVNFRSKDMDYTLRDMIGSSHPGEAESNNFQGLIVEGAKSTKDHSCAAPPTSDLAQLAEWKPADKPHALGMTGIVLSEDLTPTVVYDGPNGTRLGVLELDKNSNPHAIVRPLWIRQDDGELLAIQSIWGTFETGYEVHSLLFYAQKSGFSQVLPHTGKNGLWIQDSESSAYLIETWAEHLSTLGDVLWRNELGGLQIHRSPKEGSSLKTLKDGYYALSTTGRFKGDWVEVKVAGYTDEFICGGEGEPNGKHWKGWVRATNDDGEPTIWYYSRGC